MQVLFFVLACLIATIHAAGGMTCIGEDGKAVDWWVAFKVPDGTNYMYGDARHPGLKPSTHDMGAKDIGALALTVSQVFDTKDGDDIGYVLYNDQDPDGKQNQVHGHSKGVVGMTSGGGFWLIHSVPQYPDFTNGPYDGFAGASIKYGQSFFCQTLSLAELNDVGSNWQYSRPNTYDWNLPDFVPENIVSVVLDDKHVKDSGTQTVTYTAGSLKVTHFAKNVAWNDEIWPNLIAPYWKVGFNVETWMNGRNPDDSDCDAKYHVLEIRELEMTKEWSWTETKDHSKWGISLSGSVVCIGDINRQQSQVTRAGGYACFENAAIHKALDGFISEVDKCGSRSKLALLSDDASVVI